MNVPEIIFFFIIEIYTIIYILISKSSKKVSISNGFVNGNRFRLEFKINLNLRKNYCVQKSNSILNRPEISNSKST